MRIFSPAKWTKKYTLRICFGLSNISAAEFTGNRVAFDNFLTVRTFLHNLFLLNKRDFLYKFIAKMKYSQLKLFGFNI